MVRQSTFRLNSAEAMAQVRAKARRNGQAKHISVERWDSGRRVRPAEIVATVRQSTFRLNLK